MRAFVTLATAGLIMAAFAGPQAFAAPSAGSSKMTTCAAQWQQLKASGKTNGQTYKAFSATCMKGGTPAPTPVAAATVAKPASATTGNKPQQDKMKQCAAQWQQMKASGKTGGQTYKAFSAQCLKK